MALKPERQGLALEARNLRQFGYTQEEIANMLGIPRRTIRDWINHTAIGSHGIPARTQGMAGTSKATTAGPSIVLYPCPYEKTEGTITDSSIDLILTDPPYLVSGSDMSRSNQADLQRDFGAWDKVPEKLYKDSVAVWAKLMAKQLKVGASLYLFIGFQQSLIWCDALESSGLQFANVLLWHRVNPAPQIRKTRWCPAFDFILYFTKGPAKTFVWMGQNEMHNVVTGPICTGNEREYHPTQKPRWLLQKLLQVSSRPGDTILDPFAGTGSTAFSVGHLPSRKFILVEPEPKYSGLIQSIAQEEFKCKVTLRNI